MAGSSIKIGVDVTEFKRGMSDAQASVKALDAQIKTNEKSMLAYGKSESYVSTQAGLLNQKLEEQKKIVQNAEKSLKAMEQNGVSRSSKAYQDMQRRMLEARGAMIDTEVELNKLATGEQEAAKSADQLANSVGSIGKKMSLDQVISGINSITGALENAARKAVDFGKAFIESITTSAEDADNIATQALVLGMDVEEYQKYAKVFDQIGEITVAEWRKAKLKVQKAINDPTQDQTDILTMLGIQTHASSGGKYGMVQGAARNFEEVFWEIGETLRAKVASGELTQDMADVYANAIFGKGFDQLNPMFKLGREGFEAAVNEQIAAQEESIQKMADLNDQLVKLEGDFETLKLEVMAGLAPALQEGAKALDGLLGKLIEYLQIPEGQEAIQKLGDAVSGLFADLGKIDPQQVVEGFTAVFEKIIGGMEWLVENRQLIIRALEDIVLGWAGLKLTGGALEILKLINGVKEFNGVNTGAPTVTGGNGDVIATGGGEGVDTGTGPTGGWSAILNKLTLGGMAGAYYQGVEMKLRQMVDDFNKRTAGMDAGERAKQAVIENFNMTEEDYEALQKKINNPNYGSDGGVPFEVTPELEEGASEKLTEEIGVLNVPARLYITGGIGGGGGGVNVVEKQANGLPFVPYDGYLAMLHKGERVMTARENKYYTYNNNTYFGSVNLHNGLEVEALTKSIARNNARKNSGYGT